MNYTVTVQGRAEKDLKDIFDWIAEHDSLAHAMHVLDRLQDAILSIGRFPKRGSRPPELPFDLADDYRQVFFKPYRIIYRVRRSEVVILIVADGRRNLQSLLSKRLTESK